MEFSGVLMNFLLTIVLTIFLATGCASMADPYGSVRVKTSPSTAFVKFPNAKLEKGDKVQIMKKSWGYAAGRISQQVESPLMTGTIQKVMEDYFYEVQFDGTENFYEGDVVRTI